MVKKTTVVQYFSTLSYPTFGRKAYSDSNPPITVINSPYFWWYKFLQLNEEYKKTATANGVGKLAKLYKDFGNAYKLDFKQWWNERVYLFKEPKKTYSMHIANSTEQLAPFNSNEVVNLVVPLNWTQRSLKKYFSLYILSKVEKSKRGISVEESKAIYKLSGRWRIDAMQSAYNVYVAKKENTKMNWADIAAAAKLDIASDYKVGQKGSRTSDSRRVASIAAIRHYKRALQYIRSASSNSFPY
jgi:hypothetical protein